MSAKNAEIRHRVFSKLEHRPDLTLRKLAEDSQRIASVRNRRKKYQGAWCCLRKKVKHRFLSYSPVKERKKHDYSKKYDYPKFRYRQTSDNPQKKKHPALAIAVGGIHWAKDCPYRTKNVKTAINSDKRANSVETEK